MYTTLEKGFSAQEGYQTLTDHRNSTKEIMNDVDDDEHYDVDFSQFKRTDVSGNRYNHNAGNNGSLIRGFSHDANTFGNSINRYNQNTEDVRNSISTRPYNYDSRSRSLGYNPTAARRSVVREDLKRCHSTNLEGCSAFDKEDDVVYFETDEEIYHDPNVFNQPQNNDHTEDNSEPFYFQTDYIVDHKKAHRLSSILRLGEEEPDDEKEDEDIYMNDEELNKEDDEEEIYANSPQVNNDLPNNENGFDTDFNSFTIV